MLTAKTTASIAIKFSSVINNSTYSLFTFLYTATTLQCTFEAHEKVSGNRRKIMDLQCLYERDGNHSILRTLFCVYAAGNGFQSDVLSIKEVCIM